MYSWFGVSGHFSPDFPYFSGELAMEHGVSVVLISREFFGLYILVVGVLRVRSIFEAPFRSWVDNFFLLPSGFGFYP